MSHIKTFKTKTLGKNIDHCSTSFGIPFNKFNEDNSSWKLIQKVHKIKRICGYVKLLYTSIPVSGPCIVSKQLHTIIVYFTSSGWVFRLVFLDARCVTVQMGIKRQAFKGWKSLQKCTWVLLNLWTYMLWRQYGRIITLFWIPSIM